jgi:hypothetical protein
VSGRPHALAVGRPRRLWRGGIPIAAGQEAKGVVSTVLAEIGGAVIRRALSHVRPACIAQRNLEAAVEITCMIMLLSRSALRLTGSRGVRGVS